MDMNNIKKSFSIESYDDEQSTEGIVGNVLLTAVKTLGAVVGSVGIGITFCVNTFYWK